MKTSDPRSCAEAQDWQETYGWLTGYAPERPTDPFDIHALASIFTHALAETDWGRTAALTQALGLSFDAAMGAVVRYFPHAVVEIGSVLGDEEIERSEDEASLLKLLWRSVIDPAGLGGGLAKILARRAQRPNPLWLDLGLRSRGELSILMGRYFPELAQSNARNFRWKVYLRRSLCRDPNYTFCATPSCLDCEDFFRCFGDDSEAGVATAPASRLHPYAAAV